MDCVYHTVDQGLNATQNPQYVLTQISEKSYIRSSKILLLSQYRKGQKDLESHSVFVIKGQIF